MSLDLELSEILQYATIGVLITSVVFGFFLLANLQSLMSIGESYTDVFKRWAWALLFMTGVK